MFDDYNLNYFEDPSLPLFFFSQTVVGLSGAPGVLAVQHAEVALDKKHGHAKLLSLLCLVENVMETTV